MKERIIAEILKVIKKGLIVALIGLLLPIDESILMIGLLLWIYIPFSERYIKRTELEEKEKEKKGDNKKQ